MPGKNKIHITLQTKIQLLIIAVILISLIGGNYLIAKNISKEVEQLIANKALSIARTVSEIPEIKENLTLPNGSEKIDTLAENISNSTESDFIVIFNMEGTRFSHPNKSLIGNKIAGGDEGPVLQGKEYTSKAVGTLGPSLRAFVPILDNNEQIGAVVVGILITDLENLINQSKKKVNTAIFITLSLGFLGSIILSNNIKSELLGLEPKEIAALYKTREAILSSIKEGIIAVNDENKIILVNDQAVSLLNLDKNIIGLSCKEVIPNTRLPQVIESGLAAIDQEQLLNNKKIITNRIPIVVDNKVIGAVASFRDMTEIKRLADELSGVREYADALRAQSHQFKNKLHTISGLIQLEKYDKVVDFVINTQTKHKNNVDLLINKIKDVYVGGLLFGKMSLASERGIKLTICKDSMLPKLPESLSGSLVLILGNLIQNSIEAIEEHCCQSKSIFVSIIYDGTFINIEVLDHGSGINDDSIKKIFNRGFTTKGNDNKGIGLSIIQEDLQLLNGKIEVDSKENRGTKFIVKIPYKRFQKGGINE